MYAFFVQSWESYLKARGLRNPGTSKVHMTGVPHGNLGHKDQEVQHPVEKRDGSMNTRLCRAHHRRKDGHGTVTTIPRQSGRIIFADVAFQKRATPHFPMGLLSGEESSTPHSERNMVS